jgi:outer membrane protein TolC
MWNERLCRFLLFSSTFAFTQGCSREVAKATEKLEAPLVQIEQRLEEETATTPSEPDSLTYRRAVGEQPVRAVAPRRMRAERILTLGECLRLAFANNSEIKGTRQQMFGVGGSKLIVNSRFLPTIEIVNQYEHFRNFGSTNAHDDAYGVRAEITQRILEYGKDNPLDVSLRAEQRETLFNYENKVAEVFSLVRRAFFFIKLKEQQVATRQQSLEGFKRQYERKQRRMEEGGLSVKIEVLTARLNVLEEESRINSLKRQQFNRKMDLLRLIGLPVGADRVEFEGQMDSFGLDTFEMDGAVRLALAQNSEVAFAEALVTEQQRVLDQLRFEYMPDLRFTAGYQDTDGKVGADLVNRDDTWGLDVVGQPQAFDEEKGQTLGLFGNGITLAGPDEGWFAGVQLRLPLFEGHARKGRQIEAKADLAGLEAVLADKQDLVELGVRQSHKFLLEQKFQVELEQERVRIEKERLSIQEQLRAIGKITDDELETFRRQFFAAQDSLFREQEALIERQEDLRLSMRYFK